MSCKDHWMIINQHDISLHEYLANATILQLNVDGLLLNIDGLKIQSNDVDHLQEMVSTLSGHNLHLQNAIIGIYRLKPSLYQIIQDH